MLLTVSEVAALVCLTDRAVRYHVYMGHFRARRAGRLWLVEWSSVVEYFERVGVDLPDTETVRELCPVY